MELQVHPETTAITYYVNGEHQTTHNHTLTVHAVATYSGRTLAAVRSPIALGEAVFFVNIDDTRYELGNGEEIR